MRRKMITLCVAAMLFLTCSLTVLAQDFDPEKTGKKIPVSDWLSMMGRTKHLVKEEYTEVVERLQKETDRRFEELKKKTGQK